MPKTREQMIDEAVRRMIRHRIETRQRWRQLWRFFLCFGDAPLASDDVRDVRALFTFVAERALTTP